MTQKEFAKELGVSRYSLINYEKSSRKIPKSLHKKVKKTYNVDLIDLYRKPAYTLAKQVITFPNESLNKFEINHIPQAAPSPIIFSGENKDKIKLETFKYYLSLNEYPVQFITELDIRKLERSTCEYIEFQLFKKGYANKHPDLK